MKFKTPLIQGTLIKRYKRFLADVKLKNGKVITAHCANPGSMQTVNLEGSKVWLSPANNPNRKLKYTWEMIELNKYKIGINTSLPNNIVKEAIIRNQIPELNGYKNLKSEVKYGKNSRVDILLSSNSKPDCYVEVKNVTMRRNNKDNSIAEFPDSVTARGKKHLLELTEMVSLGFRSVMFFLIQREDCDYFSIASDIDPDYSQAFNQAMNAGVEILCYKCKLTSQSIEIISPVIYLQK
ncbi:MAG: DNA/RNA nuclease SfsA [Pseudomonadota bacterium]|nr:DNA/RNA nuclease SfsA [Pseudomonadota bacterium]